MMEFYTIYKYARVQFQVAFPRSYAKWQKSVLLHIRRVRARNLKPTQLAHHSKMIFEVIRSLKK